MGFKKISRSMDFADLDMANCLEQNRSIKLYPFKKDSEIGKPPVRPVFQTSHLYT